MLLIVRNEAIPAFMAFITFSSMARSIIHEIEKYNDSARSRRLPYLCTNEYECWEDVLLDVIERTSRQLIISTSRFINLMRVNKSLKGSNSLHDRPQFYGFIGLCSDTEIARGQSADMKKNICGQRKITGKSPKPSLEGQMQHLGQSSSLKCLPQSER